MKDLLEKCCGLDVHKDIIVACILSGPIISQKNRIEKFLQSSGLRLSSFVSDIFGVTGRGIILHLIKYGH